MLAGQQKHIIKCVMKEENISISWLTFYFDTCAA